MGVKLKNTAVKLVLTIKSSRKEELNNFLNYMQKLSKLLGSRPVIKSKDNKKLRFSVLKSPHVNKIAQEQFQKKNHSCLLIIKGSFHLAAYLFFFIKSLTNSFSGVNVIIKIVTLNKILDNNSKKELVKSLDYKKPKNGYCYLSLLDAEGELFKI